MKTWVVVVIAILAVEIASGAQCTKDEMRLESVRKQLSEQYEREQTATILALRLEGDTAVATVAQHFVRTQTKLGRLRNIDTSAVQDETWVQTPQGWRLKFVANVHGRRWYVDGKRVDPRKPYDPDAPPYNPPIMADE